MEPDELTGAGDQWRAVCPVVGQQGEQALPGRVAVVLLFLTGALALLPKATLGAVIIYAALRLMDIGAWRAFARASRSPRSRAA